MSDQIIADSSFPDRGQGLLIATCRNFCEELVVWTSLAKLISDLRPQISDRRSQISDVASKGL